MRTFLRFVWFPAAILTVFFGCWRLGRVLGLPLFLAGLATILWTNGLFLSLGEGTAHPFAPKPARLVIAGPYRYVRNPMMWGVGALISGTALWVGSAGLG